MRVLTIVFLCAILLGAPAQAAFKSSQDVLSPEAAMNPRPAPGDIILPMPCGQKMVLRPVGISSGAFIRDRTFPMGIVNVEDQARHIYERRFQGHIAAPFTENELPQEWKSQLGIENNAAAGETWYFMGKYEVSRLQWDAVMDVLDPEGVENAAQCPKTVAKDASQPVTGVSWFEVQEFLNRYNAWLVKNYASHLPVFKGTQNIAFVRLPTEEEWEFAARGGELVPVDWWANKDIFPFEENRSLPDYGVYNSGTPLQKPAPIGSRQANPLGLHDTVGNVRELVDGFFRLSIADMRNGQVERRLHGSAGGVLAKGGGFRSGELEVMPGGRDEVPLYTANGPSRANDLGFRVVLSALNIPGAQRLDQLRAEEKDIPLVEDGVAAPDLRGKSDPLEAIDALADAASGQMKTNLLQLKTLMEDHQNAQSRQNVRNLEHSFRSLLYQAETLRAFAMRYASSLAPLKKLEDLLKQPLDKANRDKVQKTVVQARGDMDEYLKSLQMGVNYYKSSLDALASRSDSELTRLFALARREYQGRGMFNEHMRHNIDALEKNLATVKKRGAAALSSMTILKDILPERHYSVLPEIT